MVSDGTIVSKGWQVPTEILNRYPLFCGQRKEEVKGRGKENYVKANETIQNMVTWTKVVVVEW